MNTPDIPHYELWGHGSIPLLMIHGFMMRGEMFYPFIEPLGMDCRMLIPDLRGYGNSRSLWGPYTLPQMLNDLINTMDANGWQTAHVLGYSMGGVLAQKMAIFHPERVRSITLCSTFAFKQQSALERLQSQMVTTAIKRIGAKGIPRLIGHQIADILGKMDRKTYEWYMRMLAENRDEVLLISALGLFKTDLRSHLKNIQTPTFVFASDSDLIVPVHHAYQLAGSIPNAKLKIIPDAGHAVLHTHHNQFTENVLKFIHRSEQKYQGNQSQAS